eukprot:scaffold21249_cov32-Tisochrysis_lutea.AAC.4
MAATLPPASCSGGSAARAALDFSHWACSESRAASAPATSFFDRQRRTAATAEACRTATKKRRRAAMPRASR